MLVNANTLLNYNRCRRFAALNDPFTSLYLDSTTQENISTFRDIFLSHLYNKKIEIKKSVNLTFEFDHEVTLSETYDFQVDEEKFYCLLPITTTDLLNLKFKENNFKYQLFTKNNDGVYTLRPNDSDSKNYYEKKEKLYHQTESVGRLVFSYAVKLYLLKKIYQKKPIKLYYVLLNSDYKYDGIAYSDGLYKIFDFSDLDKLTEIVEIALFRMINHIELNDFTPCELVKKACLKGKPGECKFVNFCYSHLPENTSILDYFNSHLGFYETVNEVVVHHDAYDLLNQGYVSMHDVPISWLSNQNHLMQRYSVDNQVVYYHPEKIQTGLETLKYPVYYLDFEAAPATIPKFKGESPYSQSVFQFSVHVQNHPDDVLSINNNHFSFIANPNKDDRELMLIELLKILKNDDSSIVVYNKTFEKTRLEELAVIFPKYEKSITNLISRLFDLLDIVKMNKTFFEILGFEEKDLDCYNFYHPSLAGSYSLKKVVKVFNENAYEDLTIKNGEQAYRSYLKLPEVGFLDSDIIKKNLFLYCRQDTYSMYEIIQGLKELIKNDLAINNSCK